MLCECAYCACAKGKYFGSFRASAEAYCLLFGQLLGPHGGEHHWLGGYVGVGYGGKAARAARAGIRDRLVVCDACIEGEVWMAEQLLQEERGCSVAWG